MSSGIQVEVKVTIRPEKVSGVERTWRAYVTHGALEPLSSVPPRYLLEFGKDFLEKSRFCARGRPFVFDNGSLQSFGDDYIFLFASGPNAEVDDVVGIRFERRLQPGDIIQFVFPDSLSLSCV